MDDFDNSHEYLFFEDRNPEYDDWDDWDVYDTYADGQYQ